MGPGAENDVAAPQADQLAAAQPCPHSNEQQRPIPPPNPRLQVWGGNQSRDFLLIEELHGAALVAFGWDRENALAMQGVGRLLKSDEAEEGVERGQSDVTGTGRALAMVFDVIEEVAQQGRVEILDTQMVRCSAKALSGKPKEKSKGIPVTGDSVRASTELSE